MLGNSGGFGAVKLSASDCLKNWQRGVELLTESGSIPRCRTYHFFPPQNRGLVEHVQGKRCAAEKLKVINWIRRKSANWLSRLVALSWGKNNRRWLFARGCRENLCRALGGLARLEGTVIAAPLEFDPMSLDHPVQCFAIYAQQARGGLLIAAGVLQHAGDVTAFNL